MNKRLFAHGFDLITHGFELLILCHKFRIQFIVVFKRIGAFTLVVLQTDTEYFHIAGIQVEMNVVKIGVILDDEGHMESVAQIVGYIIGIFFVHLLVGVVIDVDDHFLHILAQDQICVFFLVVLIPADAETVGNI